MEVIIAPKLSRPCWMNGGFTHCFVYSNKGNFMVKGFSGDVALVLEKYKAQGYKFFYNRVIYQHGIHRSYWSFYKDGVYINEPSKRKSTYGPTKPYHYRFIRFGRDGLERLEMTFKRLPKRWIKELESF